MPSVDVDENFLKRLQAVSGGGPKAQPGVTCANTIGVIGFLIALNDLNKLV